MTSAYTIPRADFSVACDYHPYGDPYHQILQVIIIVLLDVRVMQIFLSSMSVIPSCVMIDDNSKVTRNLTLP